MQGAGFSDLEVVDLTDDFLRTAYDWHEQYSAHEDELRLLIGDEIDELSKDRNDLIAGVEEGLLKRTLVCGRKP